MKTPREFVYWLQGFFELYDGDSLTDFQLNRIKQELNNVFVTSIVQDNYVNTDALPWIPNPSGGTSAPYPYTNPQIRL